MLRWPGILQSKQIDSKVMKARVLDVVGEALEGLTKARAQDA